MASLSPFLAGDFVVCGGSSEAVFNDYYPVVEPESGGNPAAYLPGYCYTVANAKPSGSTPATGGYLGTNDARFSERAPTGVQHRSHQKMIAQQAPGLSVQPKVVPVYYDMGNSTFDHTNRIMKFERDSSPGPDIGSEWTSPVSGTLTAYLESVDAIGRYLKDVNEHDIVSIDDWLSPEFAGEYVVKSKTVTTPAEGSLALVELELATYYPTAYTDDKRPAWRGVSDRPWNHLPTYGSCPGCQPRVVAHRDPDWSQERLDLDDFYSESGYADWRYRGYNFLPGVLGGGHTGLDDRGAVRRRSKRHRSGHGVRISSRSCFDFAASRTLCRAYRQLHKSDPVVHHVGRFERSISARLTVKCRSVSYREAALL